MMTRSNVILLPVSSNQPVLPSEQQDYQSNSTCQYYGAGAVPATTAWGWQIRVGF